MSHRLFGNVTAGGKEPWFPLPFVAPVMVDDPRINLGLIPYAPETGPRKPLQLPIGLLNSVVKRGWEPWTFTWNALIDVQADIFAYTATSGAVTVGNPIIRPSPAERVTISPFTIPPTYGAFPVPEQPDFTIDENERPRWVDTVPGAPPVGPGVVCPWLARAPYSGNFFPIATNINGVDQVGAIMVVECTLNISRFTPYIWNDGSAFYCALEASISSLARPAISGELGDDGNWVFTYYDSDWIFAGIDETSQELLGGTFDSTDPVSDLAGVITFRDIVNLPVEGWGSLSMFGNEFGQLVACIVNVDQHYA